jgi:hypothetical protein
VSIEIKESKGSIDDLLRRFNDARIVKGDVFTGVQLFFSSASKYGLKLGLDK